MSDWEKLRVTELKEELKSRSIPLTGLKLKQQMIDALIENDATKPEQGNDEEDVNEDDPSDVEVDQVDGTTIVNDDAKIEERDVKDTTLEERKEYDDKHGNPEHKHPEDPLLPPQLKEEDTKATEDGDEETEPVEIDTIQDAKEASKDDPFIPIQNPRTKADRAPLDDIEMEDVKGGDEPSTGTQEMKDVSPQQTSETQSSSITPSTKIPTPEILDDQRKRKRRSVSPPPDTQDTTYKRARAENGEAIPTKRESDALKDIQAATDEAQAARTAGNVNEEPLLPMEASDDPAKTKAAMAVGGLPDAPELQHSESTVLEKDDEKSATPTMPDRDVAPALHTATSSLYMRNFKRPLHIPTLRSYISQIARSSNSLDEQDPVKVFYLDNIRTHAFVSFNSIAAASRVRNLMHDTKFPDEQMREPLWIDFIPDDKVQKWIDEETGGTSGDNFGGGRSRGGGGKFEVTYATTDEGTEARLRNTSDHQPRFHQQSSSYSTDRRRPSGADALTTTSVHPSHAERIPQPRSMNQASSNINKGYDDQPQSKQSSKSDTGKGFTALDNLFSHTTTKPKLYYKPVSESVAAHRSSLFNNLILSPSEMGRSGDEGMKRYTFETASGSSSLSSSSRRGSGVDINGNGNGNEEWVDKGPEFGFGRRGQDRLDGRANGGGGGSTGGRGAGRGGGSFRGGFGRRGGDSWRGGSGR